MSELLLDYLPLVVFIAVAIGIGLALLFAPFLVADRKPDPERFTIREVVAHMADWEGVWLERARRVVVAAVVTDSARLRGAARRVGLRVEVEHDRPAAQRRQRDLLAFLVRQGEVGRLRAGLDHFSNLESLRSLSTRPSVWQTGQ